MHEKEESQMQAYRHRKGLEVLDDMMGAQGQAAYEQMKQLHPDFAEILIGLFGDFYSRPVLDKKQKALVTLTTLITQIALPQLRLHTRTALNAGLTEREITEAAIQCIPYVGFPAVTNAMQAIQEVLQSGPTNE
ncbi:carboxymuconolactone decarboxylase family protein [Paenibacillus mendelii]|uniref:Carboxymuconolactone decarboxylase family protein n=1 Tax=Paenibacillus mendelii TaxID=206163 RepID=A0ABV6J9C2_9BACL|nr:carboxymuconolactone decarboxylase family protein [Paenibacillus mendelii]MCQ6559828.1 carboxymuconolactone decarboxylase family protein [Paenibacillus mendelii]